MTAGEEAAILGSLVLVSAGTLARSAAETRIEQSIASKNQNEFAAATTQAQRARAAQTIGALVALVTGGVLLYRRSR